jgi:putative secretion ATPase (PEP-CTERM system associated)
MYESYYKLSGKPFQLNPDPRFFFSSRTHKRALAYLRYGIEQQEGFIVVTGEVGTGKTMLVSRLFKSLQEQDIAAARIVSTQIEADDLLRLVAAQFGLEFEGASKAALLRSLEHFFTGCVREGRRVLLVVDEAQNLPPRAVEELRMLSNFQWHGRPLLQSFLLGQKEFRRMMRGEGFEQLRQRVIAAYHLKALDADETRAYIEHRLQLVGWNGDPSFTPEAYAGIHGYTHGNPRRTNLLCDRVLLFGCLEELHEIGHAALQTVLEDVRQELWSNEDSGEFDLEDLRATERPPEALRHELPRPGEGGPRGRADHARGPAVDPARLGELERSVQMLTEALRDELGELRRALADERKRKDQEN